MSLGFGALGELPLATLPAAAGGAVNYTLTCSAGSYTYTGQAATLNRGIKLTCSAGAYVYTGKAATLTYVSGSAVGRLKYWDGVSWTVKTLKYWDGSAWQTKTLKYWDGGSWLS